MLRHLRSHGLDRSADLNRPRLGCLGHFANYINTQQTVWDVDFLRQQSAQTQSSRSQHEEEIGRMRADNERLRADAQAKITQLQERIKELNQKLMAAGAAVKK